MPKLFTEHNWLWNSDAEEKPTRKLIAQTDTNIIFLSYLNATLIERSILTYTKQAAAPLRRITFTRYPMNVEILMVEKPGGH